MAAVIVPSLAVTGVNPGSHFVGAREREVDVVDDNDQSQPATVPCPHYPLEGDVPVLAGRCGGAFGAQDA
ncbi:hypothetical protein GCM10010483_01470 [Actinokineospora diospyrosa]